jgi:5-methyltetrahydrofolate--homocysteine methyltransferase
VLAAVGPCGLRLDPLNEESLEAAASQYAEQIGALAAEQPDAILIESMTDLPDALCALRAAQSLCELPVIVSCVFDAQGHVGADTTDFEAVITSLEETGADVIGIEGALSFQQLLALVRRAAQTTPLPLFVRPDADTSPTLLVGTNVSSVAAADGFVDVALALRQAGVQFIGSGCGTTPAFTGAIYATVGGTEVMRKLP